MQCSKVSSFKLVLPIGSPFNPSAPHCTTIEFGWNEVITLQIQTTFKDNLISRTKKFNWVHKCQLTKKGLSDLVFLDPCQSEKNKYP